MYPNFLAESWTRHPTIPHFTHDEKQLNIFAQFATRMDGWVSWINTHSSTVIVEHLHQAYSQYRGIATTGVLRQQYGISWRDVDGDTVADAKPDIYGDGSITGSMIRVLNQTSHFITFEDMGSADREYRMMFHEAYLAVTCGEELDASSIPRSTVDVPRMSLFEKSAHANSMRAEHKARVQSQETPVVAGSGN